MIRTLGNANSSGVTGPQHLGWLSASGHAAGWGHTPIEDHWPPFLENGREHSHIVAQVAVRLGIAVAGFPF